MTESSRRFVIGLGTGRCGLKSLGALLDHQRNTSATFEQWPLLPWVCDEKAYRIEQRFQRWTKDRSSSVVGDVSSSYLPYVEEIIRRHPATRFVCLRRDREAVVNSFAAWLDKTFPIPVDHWSTTPAAGWFHEPFRTRIYPQFDDTVDRADGIRRYWDEYDTEAERLAAAYPDAFRVFSSEALESKQGQQDILSFCGFEPQQHITNPQVRENSLETAPDRQRAVRFSGNPTDPRRCAVLVPYNGSIVPQVFNALKELERRGYEVRMVPGYAAIDQGRNQIATDALIDGFEETMWIDADVAFHPDSVDQLRSHQLPLVCGIYPQKGVRALASHLLPGTPGITFGQGGGPMEILFAGTGFLHIRREVYRSIQEQLSLPMCNERFGRPMIPFFQPTILPFQDGHWYLAEDYAFCTRARRCGFRIMADTSIRLWHVGTYRYGWEDAGQALNRYDSYTINFRDSNQQDGKGSEES